MFGMPRATVETRSETDKRSAMGIFKKCFVDWEVCIEEPWLIAKGLVEALEVVGGPATKKNLKREGLESKGY